MHFRHTFFLILLIAGSVRATIDRAAEIQLFKDFGIDIRVPSDWIEQLNGKLATFNYASTYQPSDTNLLFERYPALQATIPYVHLAALPTPVQKLNNMSQEYGLNIYIKRDDLTGGTDAFGNPIYGGNKVRKLEFLLAHAQSLGARKVLTFGCAGSNHAVATAMHARRIGLEPICMLKHQPPSRIVQQNLLMHA